MTSPVGAEPDEPKTGPWCPDIGGMHEWGEWHPSMVDALLEYRLCSKCGGMEQQWIAS